MKAKLTLTVDEELIPEAKILARKHGVSLSQLVETTLRAMARAEGPSFSERWKGAFKPADRDDARYRALADKYLS